MNIIQEAFAGTLESSDVMVKVQPNAGLEIIIRSEVSKQFGKQILRVTEATLERLGVTSGLIILEDKGALDCAIIARLQTAVLRGAQQLQIDDWSKIL